jgi:hypothetical protein
MMRTPQLQNPAKGMKQWLLMVMALQCRQCVIIVTELVLWTMETVMLEVVEMMMMMMMMAMAMAVFAMFALAVAVEATDEEILTFTVTTAMLLMELESTALTNVLSLAVRLTRIAPRPPLREGSRRYLEGRELMASGCRSGPFPHQLVCLGLGQLLLNVKHSQYREGRIWEQMSHTAKGMKQWLLMVMALQCRQCVIIVTELVLWTMETVMLEAVEMMMAMALLFFVTRVMKWKMTQTQQVAVRSVCATRGRDVAGRKVEKRELMASGYRFSGTPDLHKGLYRGHKHLIRDRDWMQSGGAYLIRQEAIRQAAEWHDL